MAIIYNTIKSRPAKKSKEVFNAGTRRHICDQTRYDISENIMLCLWKTEKNKMALKKIR